MFIYCLSAFLLGLVGSVHCLGMCGPLVMGMPFHQVANKRKNVAILVYLLSKAIAYGCLGAVMGLVGKGFWQLDWQKGLSILAGISIIIIALVPAIANQIKWPPGLQRKFARVYANVSRSPKQSSFIALGFMNGLLPCGMVYTALTAATVMTSAGGGFLSMVFFGIGTSPALFSLAFLKTRLVPSHKRYLGKLSIVLAVCVGLLLIVRGFNVITSRFGGMWPNNIISCGH